MDEEQTQEGQTQEGQTPEKTESTEEDLKEDSSGDL